MFLVDVYLHQAFLARLYKWRRLEALEGPGSSSRKARNSCFEQIHGDCYFIQRETYHFMVFHFTGLLIFCTVQPDNYKFQDDYLSYFSSVSGVSFSQVWRILRFQINNLQLKFNSWFFGNYCSVNFSHI